MQRKCICEKKQIGKYRKSNIMGKQELIIGWAITGGIAVIGWIIAIVQSYRNQKLQKTIEQKKMRHDAYSNFLKELDAISKDMSISPMNTIKGIAQKYISKILTIDYQAVDCNVILNECMATMYSEMWACVEHASMPLLRISQAIAAVELDATEELMPMLQELKLLIESFNQEWQKALSSFPKDQQGLQKLSEVGKNDHWTKFESLKKLIIQQMRKECNIS